MEETTLRLKELLFPSIEDVAVLSVDMNNDAIRIEVRVTTIGSECPDCGSWSSRVHSSYLRFPADVPLRGGGWSSVCTSAGSSARMLHADG
ncbi:hypothetical protein [Streptomyces sp. YPW6]|uniref:hypothetical protein n=1 Tax=Streptomyces sp. YPW6 TaxID=2840373 RepID=UPI003EBEDF04